MLALSYHFGARSAGAQAPGNPIAAGGDPWVITANGDVYQHVSEGHWTFETNVFTSAATPAQPATFGAIKAKSARIAYADVRSRPTS